MTTTDMRVSVRSRKIYVASSWRNQTQPSVVSAFARDIKEQRLHVLSDRQSERGRSARSKDSKFLVPGEAFAKIDGTIQAGGGSDFTQDELEEAERIRAGLGWGAYQIEIVAGILREQKKQANVTI